MRDAFVDHCLELLAPLGAARAKRMFGGHGLYLDDLFVAIVAFEQLYLKVDAGTQPAFEAAGCRPFVYDGKGRPITMSYWTVPPEAIESPTLMAPWARRAVEAALRARSAAALRPPGRSAAARTTRAAPNGAAAPAGAATRATRRKPGSR